MWKFKKIALPAAAWAAIAASAFAVEPQSPSRSVQRTVLRQMGSVKAERREAGIATLKEYPTAAAARLLTEHGLTSEFDDVRHASYRLLQDESDSQEVCDVLLDKVQKSFRKGTAGPAACGMLGALLSSELEPVEQKTAELLGQAARQPGAGWGILTSLADEFGLQGGDRSVKSLVKLSEQPWFDRVFAARRAIVQALARIEEPEAIDALISLLARAQGEVRGDIARRLTAVSGKPYALDADRWREWRKASRDSDSSYSSRELRPAPVYAPLVAAAPSHYYGLPIYAQRLVFVLDTSGSMSGLRLAAAQRELLQAIGSLPAGVGFNVLVFNQGVVAWQEQLAPASPENKALAAAFVMSQHAFGATWTYDALAAAFDFDAESIYLLTDGEPCGGTITNPAAIVAVLAKLNHARRVTINSIGVGVGLPGSPFDVFLQALAVQNYGEYRRVNQ